MMIRLGALFWLLLVSATGAAMFVVKYQVQDLEAALVRTAKATVRQQHEIRMLTAEWAYLNRPDGLAQLNQRYLSLVPIATRQLQTAIDDIPLRPPPTPPAAIDTVAAAEPAVPALLPVATVPPPKPALIEMASKPGPERSAKSLDDLFARIAASRR